MLNSAALRRGISVLAGATAVLVASGVVSGPASGVSSAVPPVTIQDPGTPTAGRVQLRGTVTALTTTVLFAADVSTSTAHPDRLDCNGDGFAGGNKDDLNGDNSAGDILDCEISGVIALNDSLAASPGTSLVTLQKFNTHADPLPLKPGSSTPLFAAPGDTGGGATPLLDQAALGLRRAAEIGTNYNLAVTTALHTLAGAPAGPKWIMFLSDGQGALDDPAVQNALKSSGVNLRPFSPSADGCNPSVSGLPALAALTGQPCVPVSDPTQLGAEMIAAQPDNVTAVRVTISGKTFPAALALDGGWRADLTLGAGSYAAHVTATLSSGGTVSADRSFTVNPLPAGTTPPPGTTTPPPGSVAGTPGTVSATPIVAGALGVRTPAPVLTALPAKVSGRVGTPGSGGVPVANAGLEGATVLLQGQGKLGTAWRNVGRSLVSRGAYTLTWKRSATVKRLRVVLLPYRTFTGATKAVPRPGISSCVKKGTSSRWTMTCLTTAKNGTKARLLKSGHVVARTKVARGHVSVAGSGRPSAYLLVVDVSAKRHLRLRL